MPTPAGLRPSAGAGSSLEELALAAGADLIPPASGGQIVTGVTLDSRAARPGDLYAALPGSRAHGADFAQQAADAGALALLTDPVGASRAQGSGLPVLVADEPRAVLGRVAARVYGHPSRDLLLLGVTGTNGKTTTTFLLDAALRAIGRTTGMIGTVETRVADQSSPSVRTTPEAPDLHRLLATMRERHVTVCSMEISSQALVQHRVDGVVVDVAGFTSFSQDHLELHGDMPTYLAAKALLFTPEHARCGVVVVDDDGSREIAATAGVPVTTVSASAQASADWTVTDREPDGVTTRFALASRRGEVLRLRCPLPGDFNVMNTALAAVMLLTAGIESGDVTAGLARAGGVPGRMEQVGDAGAGRPLAVVDYAHTPDAVAAALQTLRGTVAPGGRLVVVLGAGGDRDPGKRPGMGAAAADNADVVVITDDNPRTEVPADIRAAVLAGARASAERSGSIVLEFDRRAAAIQHAAGLVGAGDVLLVAGKGHEQGQEVAGVVHPFDDREVLATALAATRSGTAGATGRTAGEGAAR